MSRRRCARSSPDARSELGLPGYGVASRGSPAAPAEPPGRWRILFLDPAWLMPILPRQPEDAVDHVLALADGVADERPTMVTRTKARTTLTSATIRQPLKTRWTSLRPAARASMSSRRRVDVEARAGRRRQVEPLVERHRAVVAGADRDPEAVEHLGDVVRVDARQVERDDAAAERRGPSGRRARCPGPRAAAPRARRRPARARARGRPPCRAPSGSPPRRRARSRRRRPACPPRTSRGCR